ncbi:hypothetical protein [Fodinibius saliphilus]|uniref:hypothetical protein n=1 Tax=Fodinibius saliphilus TaxID=1920650 RepID=UPI001107D3E7|nr:hypothetical protein [Fodinibius saliphilus]
MVKKILKIAAFILGPILPLMVVIYFLFPYINEQEYEEIAEKYKDTPAIVDTSANNNIITTNTTINTTNNGNDDINDIGIIGGNSETLKGKEKVFQENIKKLKAKVDSLTIKNDSLSSLVVTQNDSLNLLRQELAFQDSISQAQKENSMIMDEEAFAEKVKSLLSLDDENLAPIINELSDKELVRLYQSGSSRQRKKLLRSLQSKRAAKLMTEVM